MQKENLTKKQKEQSGISLDTKKEIAKIGMTASMGVVVATSFFMKKNKLSKRLHIGAGAALVGFSLWHHLLYQPEKKAQKTQSKNSDIKKVEKKENPNISLKHEDNFTELAISKSFQKKDFDDLETVLKDMKFKKLLIKIQKTDNKQKRFWSDFLTLVGKYTKEKECALYALGMKTLFKQMPQHWYYAPSYKKAKEWFSLKK